MNDALTSQIVVNVRDRSVVSNDVEASVEALGEHCLVIRFSNHSPAIAAQRDSRLITVFAMALMGLISVFPLIAGFWMQSTGENETLAELSGRFGSMALTGFCSAITYFFGRAAGANMKSDRP